MDFFEKAHVIRKQPPKIIETDENMKRQLKQMLYGYKKSNTAIIKKSAYLNFDINEEIEGFNDSASVSGFSDLNLTVSDHEADNSHDIISKSSANNVSNIRDEESSHSSVVDNLEGLSDNSIQSSLSGLESQENQQQTNKIYVSDLRDDFESLESQGTPISEGSVSSDDIYLTEAFEETSSELATIDSDSEFDPDGSLASKILEKLGQKEVIKRKVKKRKSDVLPKLKTKLSVNESKNTNYENVVDIAKLSIESNNEEASQDYIVDSSTQDSTSTDQSSQFISISATALPDQNLSDILGDYRHPTVRNLPSEKHNIIYSRNHQEFSTDDMQVEDIDSLVPELGDNQIIEDFDLNAESNSMVAVDESTDIYDTLQSESVVDLFTDEETSDTVKVYFGNNNACIFVLKHPTELFVNGKVKITPLGGTAEVFGHVLKEKVNLYAPNNSYAQCIKTIGNENVYYGLFGKLTGQGLTVAETEDIVTSIGEYDVILSFEPLNEPKIYFVDNNFPITDLFNRASKKNSKIDRQLMKASNKLNCSIYLTRPWRYFEENEAWNLAIDYGLCVGSRGIVCGGKGLGKSTFLRYYVNRLLSKGPVLVIDLDPGQAEFTVAGNISATVVNEPLLGPNFTHLKRPAIMLNIGMINVMDNMFRYATAVAELLAHCRSTYSHLPWIINTMGMCNHTGLKLITYIIVQAKPLFLLQIDSKVVKKRFPIDLKPSNVTELYYKEYRRDKLFRDVPLPANLHYSFVSTPHVEGSERHNSSLSPRDERYLNFLAYFGELLHSHSKEGFLGIVPYEVNLSDVNLFTNVKVAPESVTRVLNGKVLALCRLGGDKGRLFTLADKPLRCYGHGLIRSVDSEKGLLYIVTPTPTDVLCTVDSLVYADWVPQLGGQEATLPSGTPIPYHTSHAQQHKHLMLSPRRRFNPLQLLKMSRNT